MFLGWHDPDKKTPTRAKVASAMVRYIEKFDDEPTTLVCHPTDWELHEREREQGIGGSQFLRLDVRTETFIPRHTFYVGHDDPKQTT